MKRYKLRKGRCLICIVFAFMIFTFTGTFFEAKAENVSAADEPKDLIPIYVNEGDTLWNIVQDNCDYSGDIRDFIRDVKELNNLKSSNITAGDIIYVPVN